MRISISKSVRSRPSSQIWSVNSKRYEILIQTDILGQRRTSVSDGSDARARPEDREAIVVGEEDLVLAGTGQKTSDHRRESRLELSKDWLI